jgi:hypothetical protein
MDDRAQGRQAPRSTTQFYDAAIGVSWFAWPIFAIVTVAAMFGEMFTRFANAGPGYYFIMLGMPAFCIAWLYLLIYASFRPVPTRWPVAALLAALVIIAGYATIG